MCTGAEPEIAAAAKTAGDVATADTAAAAGLSEAGALATGGVQATTPSLLTGAQVSSALGAVGSTVLSKLLAPDVNIPAATLPAVTKPTALPDAQAQIEAKRRAILQQVGRQGRASTILTDQSDKLG